MWGAGDFALAADGTLVYRDATAASPARVVPCRRAEAPPAALPVPADPSTLAARSLTTKGERERSREHCGGHDCPRYRAATGSILYHERAGVILLCALRQEPGATFRRHDDFPKYSRQLTAFVEQFQALPLRPDAFRGTRS